MPDHAVSPKLTLDNYDLSRIGVDSIIAVLAIFAGWLADWLPNAMLQQDWGHFGPAVTVAVQYAGDILRRFARGWLPTDMGSIMRNALWAAIQLGVIYGPELLAGHTSGELGPVLAALIRNLLEVARRWLASNQPDFIPAPTPPPSLFSQGTPPVAPMLLVVMLSASIAMAGPIQTYRVTATVGGKVKTLKVLAPEEISDVTIELGDPAAPTPVPPTPPQPEPQPVPPPPNPPAPNPQPVPPQPQPTPPAPQPLPEPTFPVGTYDIAATAYRLALTVATTNRKAEAAALADQLEQMQAQCLTGTLANATGDQCAADFQARTATALGGSLATWKAQFGNALMAKLALPWTLGRLNTGREWAVLLAEMIPALREAAKR